MYSFAVDWSVVTSISLRVKDGPLQPVASVMSAVTGVPPGTVISMDEPWVTIATFAIGYSSHQIDQSLLERKIAGAGSGSNRSRSSGSAMMARSAGGGPGSVTA